MIKEVPADSRKLVSIFSISYGVCNSPSNRKCASTALLSSISSTRFVIGRINLVVADRHTVGSAEEGPHLPDDLPKQ